MTTGHSTPYVSLEEFLDMEPPEGAWLEWSGGFVYATRDRGEKFAAYKQITALEEYVLVSQDARRIEVRRRGARGWSSDIAEAGQTIRIHGHDIAVDAIDGPAA